MTRRFQKSIENFTCNWCGAKVKGTGYTDHCPNCLASMHVDINPGDRASLCHGKMVPSSSDYKSGQFTINYKCGICHVKKCVKAAAEDNKELLFSLAGRKPNKKDS